MLSKISSKGQLVLPKYLRDAVNMHPGDNVVIVKVDDKLMVIKKPKDAVDALLTTGQKTSMKNIRRRIKEE